MTCFLRATRPKRILSLADSPGVLRSGIFEIVETKPVLGEQVMLIFPPSAPGKIESGEYQQTATLR